jgi:hypothetical protein
MWAGQDLNLRSTDYESAALTVRYRPSERDSAAPARIWMVDEDPNEADPRPLAGMRRWPR